jgi:uncharacterized protein DUF2330
MRRTWTLGGLTAAFLLVGSAVAMACGGLIAPNGTVQLLRTSTLSAYHNGLEHYITSFQFTGEGKEFGSIVPLPGIPRKVERGGSWTLQRLQRETQPQPETFAAAGTAARAPAPSAVVIYQTRIDALDITILKGGARAVGKWARDHGYFLPPDSPAVLEFYARRSQIFMAARFDTSEARKRGQNTGDGTPIHLTIPTRNPWVPLRILALGRPGQELVQADVYLLTDRRPALLARKNPGLFYGYDAPASKQLLDDLRSDKGMKWIPRKAHLTLLRLQEEAKRLTYDLAIDASGKGRPSLVDAGLVRLKPVPGIVPSPARLDTERPRTLIVSPPGPPVDLQPVSSRTGEIAIASGAGVAAAALLAIAAALIKRRARSTT